MARRQTPIIGARAAAPRPGFGGWRAINRRRRPARALQPLRAAVMSISTRDLGLGLQFATRVVLHPPRLRRCARGTDAPTPGCVSWLFGGWRDMTLACEYLRTRTEMRLSPGSRRAQPFGPPNSYYPRLIRLHNALQITTTVTVEARLPWTFWGLWCICYRSDLELSATCDRGI